jgi:hypothetical protein
MLNLVTHGLRVSTYIVISIPHSTISSLWEVPVDTHAHARTHTHTHTHINKALRYIAAPRELRRVRGNAGGGTTWWFCYEGCLHGVHAKQITTANIYMNATQWWRSHQWARSLNPYCFRIHCSIYSLVWSLYPNEANKPECELLLVSYCAQVKIK